MSKLGKQFELVVSDVVKEMDPGSTVRQGEWVEGPDGARELDVIVEGTVDGVMRRIQIECRDYNPKRRSIGIGHIDALDSKHRDLNIDVSLLCSNAGFTKDAIRKAKRLGIGLIGVLRENDQRIRYRVIDEMYIRRVDFVPRSANISFDFIGCLPPQGSICCEEIMYEGLPVYNWLVSRVAIFIYSNPIVKGVHSLNFRFKHPIEFTLPFNHVLAKAVRIQFKISGGWFAQRVEIDATSGLYDWIRRTIRLGLGPGKISYKGVKFGEGGNPIDRPPDFELANPRALAEGEVYVWISDIGGIDVPKNIPVLDNFVLDDDLEPVHHDLPSETYYSEH